MTDAGARNEGAPLGLAITVEEWFQDGALAAAVMRSQWERLPSRVDANVAAWLALLDEVGARATFFVDRYVVERCPAVVGSIVARGHEVRGDSLMEACAVAMRSGRRVEIARGDELRRGLRDAATAIADVVAFCCWEIDAEQPRITAGPRALLQQHYEGLASTAGIVRTLRGRRALAPLCDALSLAPCPLRIDATVASTQPQCASADNRAASLRAVSVVVPLFDEEDNVVFLLRSLDALRDEGKGEFAFEFVLVDDCSRDATWSRLQHECADRSDVLLVRHDRNQGVAAAIRTGSLAASHDIVASIDCDGSYDPLTLLEMIPLLDGADLVTASPYHLDGAVRNVPGWRLLLSRTLSGIYRIALRRRIATWTSCCRVMRRSLVAELPLMHGGFLGIAETMLRVVRRGGRVVEHPTTLSSRILGFSKMKTLRTVRGHVGLLFAVVTGRIR